MTCPILDPWRRRPAGQYHFAGAEMWCILFLAMGGSAKETSTIKRQWRSAVEMRTDKFMVALPDEKQVIIYAQVRPPPLNLKNALEPGTPPAWLCLHPTGLWTTFAQTCHPV